MFGILEHLPLVFLQDSNVALIRELRKEIERLHSMLADAQSVSIMVTFINAQSHIEVS